ncbi:MAG: cistern family PEP-CTERM protein [Nitrospiraceae bacterium]
MEVKDELIEEGSAMRKTWMAFGHLTALRFPAVRNLFGLALCVSALATPLDAKAITVTGPTTFGVGYSFVTPGGDSLNALGTYNVTSLSSTLAQLQVTIQNTTNAGLSENVSGIGFNTNPAVTASFVSAGSVFDGLANDTNFPSFQTIEVCVFTGANCSASPFGQGLGPGSGTFTDTFSLNLAGNFGTTPSLTFSTFAIKFAGDLGSFETQGSVPIPGTLLLLGAGLAGFVPWHLRYGRRNTSRLYSQ